MKCCQNFGGSRKTWSRWGLVPISDEVIHVKRSAVLTALTGLQPPTHLSNIDFKVVDVELYQFFKMK